MKPDKHKQKRSQQYKKKHGLSADKETKSKSKTPFTQNEHQHDKKLDVSSQKAIKSTCGAEANSSQSNEDDNGADVQRSRVLPSNWEQYEELPEGTDVITSHGADFSTLLQSSSSAVSQFRFADELALDEDVGDKHSQGYLTIEPNEIVAALACIPLHKKLNVEEKYFEKEHIRLFVEEAENNRKLYGQKLEQQKSKQTSAKTESPAVEEHPDHTVNDPDLDGVTNDHGLKTNNICSSKGDAIKQPDIAHNILQDLDDILCGEKTGLFPDDGLDESKTLDCDPLLQDQKINHPSVDSDELVDDTDNMIDKGVTKSVQMTANIEDELDKLLSLEDGGEDGVIAFNVDKANSQEVKSTEEDSKGLEDWLDSVLED